jgi:hypothetical protein
MLSIKTRMELYLLVVRERCLFLRKPHKWLFSPANANLASTFSGCLMIGVSTAVTALSRRRKPFRLESPLHVEEEGKNKAKDIETAVLLSKST